jgi:peroxiredoxin Q/BCP
MLRILLALFTLALAAVAAYGQADTSKGLKVGDQAPDFTLPYATKDSVAEEPLKLSSLYGKGPIVLAFYPADWSGGCTKEVCTLRDNFTALAGLNAEILGVSGDYEYTHHEWAQHHNLPFRLVSDHRHQTAQAYSSYNDATGFNRRTVYVIDKSGKIAYIDPKYSVRDANSFDKLKAALGALQ